MDQDLRIVISSDLKSQGFDETNKKLTDLNSHTDKIGSSFKWLMGVIGSIGAISLFKDNVTETLDFADSLNKLRQKTGISTSELYSLSAAAKLSDVDFEILSGSLGKFNKNIGTASEGSGDAKKAFDRLGISIKNQDGTLKSSFDILGEMADQFEQMPDGATKTTTAMTLFGKAGAALIPLLNGGKDSLKEYLGVMDDDTGKAAERFNDSVTKISLSTKSGLMEVMKQALPFMESMSTEFENMAAKGSFVSHNAEYIAGSFDILSATMQGSKEVFSSINSTAGTITDTFHGIADSITGYDASLKEANDTTEKTLTFFQFLAVDIKTASLAVTIVSNTVQAATNDFMNLGFEAEKAFLKTKSFIGAGSKEDDYRVDQLSSFIANRNMDSADLALKEIEIAQSIMDYQNKASAQNWARENNVLSAFDTISKTELKGVSDTQKIIDTYNNLDKAKEDAIAKAGGDVAKIETINAKYQATAQKLNNGFATTSDKGVTNAEDAVKSYNSALAAQISGLEKQYDIKKQIENLNAESALRNEAISKPEAEFMKEKNDILSQIAKNQATVNLLETKHYDDNNKNDEIADKQKINDLLKENELEQKKLIAAEQKKAATIKATNDELLTSIRAIDMSDTDKKYQDLAKSVEDLINKGGDLASVGKYATQIADQIAREDAYSHLQTELDIRSQIAEVSLYGTQRETAMEQIRHDSMIANLSKELDTKKLNADEYLKLLGIENQRHKQNADSFYQFMLESFDNVNKAMDENFFNAMTGKFKHWGDWFKDFFSSIGTSAAQGLSRTLAGGLTSSLQSSFVNVYKSYGGASGGSSLVGETLNASDLAKIMSSTGTTVSDGVVKTSGGTVIDQATGTVKSQGSDALSILNGASSIKTAYGMLTDGISGSILSGFNSVGNFLGNAGFGSLGSGISQFGAGFSSPFSFAAESPMAGLYGSGIGSTSGATMAGGMLSSGLIGYGIGTIGDKLFGAKTQAANLAAVGATIGSIVPGIGTLLGAAIGGVIGGFFGSTKVTGTRSGVDVGTSTAQDSSGQYYSETDYKKKSWFSSKSWTDYKYQGFSDVEIDAIKKTIGVYDYLLTQLGEYSDLVVSGGRFSSLQNFLDTNVVKAFLGAINPNNLDAIYQTWTDYAKSIDKTVTEALSSAVSSYTTEKRSFTEWKLGSGTVDQLKFTAEYLQSDFEALANSMGASTVTVDNFLSMYDAAIKSNFTQDTIDNWKSLGDSFISATDASKKYKDALDSITNSTTTLSLPEDMLLKNLKVSSTMVDLGALVVAQNTGNKTSSKMLDYIYEIVKAQRALLKAAKFGIEQGIPA